MIKRFVQSAILAMMGMLLFCGVASATWQFIFPIKVADTSGITRAYYPVMLGFGGQSLFDSAKISASGNNTNMQIGSANISYMMSTTNVTAVIPSLPAGGVVNTSFYTGYSPEQSGFPIIVGDSGNVTVSDNATIEPGDNFTYQTTGWINTDAGAGKDLILKPNAFRTFVSNTVAENVTAAITTAGAATETLRPDGNSICVLPNEAGAACPNHFQNVDEAVVNDGDWVSTVLAAANLTDVYTLANTGIANTGVISSVTATIRGHNGGTNGEYRVGLSIGANTTWGTIRTDAAFATHVETLAKPGGGDWLVSDLNALLYAVNVYTPGGGDSGFVSWCYITVYYTDWDVAVSATGVSSGEHTVDVSMDSPFLSLGIDANSPITPPTDNLTLNLPLWQTDFNTAGANFTSIDSNAFECDPVGAVWTGQGFVFAGNNDWISIPDDTLFDLTAGGTIIVWLYTAGVDGGDAILSKGDRGQGVAGGWNLTQDGVNLDFEVSNGIVISRVPLGDISLSTWTHVAITQPASNFIQSSYNNVANPDDTPLFFPAANAFLVNVAADGGVLHNRNWDGTIGEVYVSNIVLSATEITRHFNATKSKYTTGDIYTYSTLVSVPDNSENWTFMAGNSMSYADNITLSVNGTQHLYFAPTAMLVGATIPDRGAGVDNPGTINWGSNTNVNISYGALESYESYIASIAILGGFDVPEATIPSTWFASGENVANLPFYDAFSKVAAETGRPVQMIYATGIIGLAFGAFLMVVMFTRSALMAWAAMVMVLIIGSSQTIIPWWIPFTVIISGLSIMYLYRQVA